MNVPKVHLKNSTLLKTPLWVSIATLLGLVVLSFPLIMILNQYHEDIVRQNFIEQESRVLNEQIKQKIDIGDSIAIAYAQNTVIRNALLFEERAPIISELQLINREYAQKTRFKNIQAHIITADGRSLVKTFELDSYNQDLTEHDLVKRAVETGQAISGINIGGAASHFRVINIQPIYSLDDESEVIGFVAISQGLRSVVESFHAHQVDYALFSSKSNQIDSDGREFTIGKAHYFDASPMAGFVFIQKQIRTDNLYFLNDRLVYTQPILDYGNHILAVHAVSIPLDVYYARVWQRNVDAIYILGAILLSTLSVSGLLLMVMKRSVIRPLAVFEKTIKKVNSSKEYSTSVKINSDDEIGRLSEQFNILLRQTEDLIHSLQYQQQAIDSSLIVSKTDLYGKIVYVNQPFERISGYSSKELIGKSHNLVRHPDMSPELFKDMWMTIESKRPWKGQIKNRAKDGSAYFVTVNILPIANLNGEVTDYLSIQEDITQLIELKESLQTAKEVAEKANQAKSQFLSSMSHELRTPLNSIIGFAQLLEFSNLSEKQKSQLQNITKSGRHLLLLINDILELAKIESGNLDMSLEPVNLKELIVDALHMVEALAKQKQIKLHCTNGDNLDHFINADYTRIKQVLLNFLSNGIKYNKDQGEIYVYVETFDKDGAGWIRIHVKDTGLGIPRKELKRLFEPFNRLGHENSNIEGSGIGLSIAKDLVERQGGEIGVESEQGIGSDFWFAFPLIDREQAVNRELSNTILNEFSHDATSTPFVEKVDYKKVLYIEDNPSNIGLMEDIVETLNGVSLTVANTAELGLEEAKKIVPDIMFIDINLPGMNGDELLPLLKQLPELRENGTVFYALTANAMIEDVDRGLEIGFDRYLTKPINVAEVIALLSQE